MKTTYQDVKADSTAWGERAKKLVENAGGTVIEVSGGMLPMIEFSLPDGVLQVEGLNSFNYEGNLFTASWEKNRAL